MDASIKTVSTMQCSSAGNVKFSKDLPEIMKPLAIRSMREHSLKKEAFIHTSEMLGVVLTVGPSRTPGKP